MKSAGVDRSNLSDPGAGLSGWPRTMLELRTGTPVPASLAFCRAARTVTRWVAFLLILSMGNLAAGHAVVVKASLDDRPVPAETATTVTVHFSSRLELQFSSFVLLRAARTEPEALKFASGEQPGDVQVDLPPLSAGAYGIRYRVRAADGHITEDVLRFRVE